MKKIYSTPIIEVTRLNLTASIIETSGSVKIGTGAAEPEYAIKAKELDFDDEEAEEDEEW